MLKEQTDRNYMKTRVVKEFSREYGEPQQAIFERMLINLLILITFYCVFSSTKR